MRGLTSAAAAPAADGRGSADPCRGYLVVNADDWGRDRTTTDMILDCTRRGTVSAVSAMVFMEDSERAAVVAREHDVAAGLHLNLTEPFAASGVSGRLLERHRQVMTHLLRHRLSQVVFHPGLTGAFEYVVKAQLDEFRRVYGADPQRLDGHHHMHLCANVLLGKLMPEGTLVRRSFSFAKGEKSMANRLYRQFVDARLASRHRLTDYFFSLEPLEPASRLQQVFALARDFVIELETHPVNLDEHRFLAGGEILRRLGAVRIKPFPGRAAAAAGA
jgi:predicted glycoside hydrolase/deacetylase ChbG (UPF0249 family)